MGMARVHLIMALVACADIHYGACIRLSRRPDIKYSCVQKDNLTGVIQTTLANLSLDSLSFKRARCPPAKFIDPPARRRDLGALLRDRGLAGIGVEVGVQKGRYTRTLLEGWRQAALFIQVDAWQHLEKYADKANYNNSYHSYLQGLACKEAVDAQGKHLVGQVVQCKDFSTECARLIPDGSLDFVYLDARHDRKGVLEDLKAYWPKLRIEGIMAGHDYMEQFEVAGSGQHWEWNYDGTTDETGRTVRGAVNDFFSGTLADSPRDLKHCPRQPVITYQESAWNSWIVAK